MIGVSLSPFVVACIFDEASDTGPSVFFYGLDFSDVRNSGYISLL